MIFQLLSLSSKSSRSKLSASHLAWVTPAPMYKPGATSAASCARAIPEKARGAASNAAAMVPCLSIGHSLCTASLITRAHDCRTAADGPSAILPRFSRLRPTLDLHLSARTFRGCRRACVDRNGRDVAGLLEHCKFYIFDARNPEL